jgi:hypothetical protein
MSDLKQTRIAGVIYYAKDLSVPNKTFDETNERFELTLGELSERACEALEAMGVKVKEKEGPGKHIKSKTKFMFEPMDEDGNPIDVKKVGNGSKAVILMTPYKHKLSGKHGMGVRVHRLIITDLKVYDPQGSVEDTTEAL